MVFKHTLAAQLFKGVQVSTVAVSYFQLFSADFFSCRHRYQAVVN